MLFLLFCSSVFCGDNIPTLALLSSDVPVVSNTSNQHPSPELLALISSSDFSSDRLVFDFAGMSSGDIKVACRQALQQTVLIFRELARRNNQQVLVAVQV